MTMSRRIMVAFLAALCAMASWVPQDAGAAPVVLQIKPLPVPAVTADGYRGRATVTVYLTVPDAAVVPRVCARLPRLNDAVIQAFEAAPVRLADAAADVAARQQALRSGIEASLGTGVFRALHLFPGALKRAQGSEIRYVDGTTRDCQAVAALPSGSSGSLASVPVPVAETLAQGDARSAPPSSEATTEAPAAAAASADDVLPLPDAGARKPFPPEPVRTKPPSWIAVFFVIAGLGTLMLLIGGYIGYQVAKIRRDRRRRDRRRRREERRAGVDRRVRDQGPPPEGERRKRQERRAGGDRRKGERRSRGDRRDDDPPEGDPPTPSGR